MISLSPQPTGSGFESLRRDAGNACLWRGTQAIPLTRKTFAVLAYLIQHSGQLVTKEELLAAVWPDTVVTDGVLKACIRRIRRVLGDEVHTPQFIETVHR